MPKTVNKNKAGLSTALKILRNGGAIVFPTETVYGLGAISTDKKAVRKIYLIKQRPENKLLPVIVGSMAQAKKYFHLSGNELKLAGKFWPGALSIILRTKSKKLASAAGTDLLAVRLSKDTFARKLATISSAPLISTSANMSGKPSCNTTAEVKKQFSKYRNQPDLYIDGGKLKKSLPSTIISIEENRITIVREGVVPISKIIRALKS